MGPTTAVGAVEAETGWLVGLWARLAARLTLGLTEGEPLFPLVVLFGFNCVDELDKTAFNVLAPEIRRSFHLGISGILALVATIELVAILLGVPLAYWADRRSRVRLARGRVHIYTPGNVIGFFPVKFLLGLVMSDNDSFLSAPIGENDVGPLAAARVARAE